MYIIGTWALTQVNKPHKARFCNHTKCFAFWSPVSFSQHLTRPVLESARHMLLHLGSPRLQNERSLSNFHFRPLSLLPARPIVTWSPTLILEPSINFKCRPHAATLLNLLPRHPGPLRSRHQAPGTQPQPAWENFELCPSSYFRGTGRTQSFCKRPAQGATRCPWDGARCPISRPGHLASSRQKHDDPA